MHLTYTQKRGYFSKEELGCLSRALGDGLFPSNVPSTLLGAEYGINIEDLFREVERYKLLHKAVDRSVNIHTDEWNLKVFRRAAQLVSTRVFTFDELQEIRVAFQTYESADTKGMPTATVTLHRAIKLCGRMMSPLKLRHRLKHMQPNFDEPDRIQLDEFLDLLLWCERYQGMVVRPSLTENAKDEKELFELTNFERLLTHYDHRLSRHLDNDYVRQERKFFREKHRSRRLPKDVPPVNPDIRRRQVKFHNGQYKGLRADIVRSQNQLYHAKAGYVRRRPLSAPDLTRYQAAARPSSMATRQDGRQSVMETFGHIIRPQTTAHVDTQHSRDLRPRPSPPDRCDVITPHVVNQADIDQSQSEKEALKFELETLDMEYKQMLYEDMEFYFPGVREKMNNRPQTAPEPITQPARPKREPRPSDDVINRLASPPTRMPLPCHARHCDAWMQNWVKPRKRRPEVTEKLSHRHSPGRGQWTGGLRYDPGEDFPTEGIKSDTNRPITVPVAYSGTHFASLSIGLDEHEGKHPTSSNDLEARNMSKSSMGGRRQDLASGGRDLVPMRQDLASGGRDLVPMRQDLASGGRDLVPMRQDLASGGRDLAPGIPDLVAGGRDLALGGLHSLRRIPKVSDLSRDHANWRRPSDDDQGNYYEEGDGGVTLGSRTGSLSVISPRGGERGGDPIDSQSRAQRDGTAARGQHAKLGGMASPKKPRPGLTKLGHVQLLDGIREEAVVEREDAVVEREDAVVERVNTVVERADTVVEQRELPTPTVGRRTGSEGPGRRVSIPPSREESPVAKPSGDPPPTGPSLQGDVQWRAGGKDQPGVQPLPQVTTNQFPREAITRDTPPAVDLHGGNDGIAMTWNQLPNTKSKKEGAELPTSPRSAMRLINLDISKSVGSKVPVTPLCSEKTENEQRDLATVTMETGGTVSRGSSVSWVRPSWGKLQSEVAKYRWIENILQADHVVTAEPETSPDGYPGLAQRGQGVVSRKLQRRFQQGSLR